MAPTIDELITSLEVEEQQAIKRRDAATETVKVILAQIRGAGRANATAEEDAEMDSQFKIRDDAKVALEGIKSRLARARKAQAAEAENELALRERAADPKTTDAAARSRPAYDQVARIGNEERTYNPGNAKRGGLFVRDVLRQYLYRDLESEQRLLRHMQEERVERGQYLERAVGTGAFAGLTVPQYLTEMYAPATAALRPFADNCNQHDLPPQGMTVNISRITTATGVALQATENTAVQNTDIDDTLLTENVQTAAGQQVVSRQAIDRGTGVEEIVVDDLFRRYATALDSTLINQATTGLSAVAASTAYTDASPTAAELWPKILSAGADAEAGLLGFAMPDLAVMHSRRWYWLQSQLTTSWPMFGQPGIPTQQFGVNLGKEYGSGARGILPNGMVAIVDNNIATNKGAGTNEDEIFVVAASECHLWEDPDAPVFVRAEQPLVASLGVQLVLYGYFAYSFRRFTAAVGKVAGTGLVTPTF